MKPDESPNQVRDVALRGPAYYQKSVSGLKNFPLPIAANLAGWVEWSRRAMPASDQRLFPLNVPGLCEGGRPPFCSLNALVLSMQGLLSCWPARLLLGARGEGF
jgi:hypothetical protein